MNIAALEEYGLRCALQLAHAYGQGTLAASQIAEKEGISVEYVSKVMHLFRKAEIVTATRGIQGGFALVKAPEGLVVKDVLDALKGKRSQSTSGFCDQFTGRNEECVHLEVCSIRPVWQVLFSYFDSVLKDLTLADLASGDLGTGASQVEQVASHRAEELKSLILKKNHEGESAVAESVLES